MHKGDRISERAEGMSYSAFIAGAFFGAGAALLLASQAGAELRGMLSEYAGRAKDDLLERAEEAYDKGEEGMMAAGQSAQEFSDQTQEFIREPGRSAL